MTDHAPHEPRRSRRISFTTVSLCVLVACEWYAIVELSLQELAR